MTAAFGVSQLRKMLATWERVSVRRFLRFQCTLNQIGFEGIRGDSYSSDIALDDISISPGGCSEQMVNDEPSHRPTLPLLPNGKRRRSSGRRRTVKGKSADISANVSDWECAFLPSNFGCYSMSSALTSLSAWLFQLKLKVPINFGCGT